MSEHRKVALAMLRVSDSLGHPLPWANFIAAFPGSPLEANMAVADLITEGLVATTTRGLVFSLTCHEHPAPAALADPTEAGGGK